MKSKFFNDWNCSCCGELQSKHNQWFENNICEVCFTQEIYYFEDWVNNMLNDSDYSEFELMCFEEHYQNLLDDEQNTENFLLWKETQTELE